MGQEGEQTRGRPATSLQLPTRRRQGGVKKWFATSWDRSGETGEAAGVPAEGAQKLLGVEVPYTRSGHQIEVCHTP